LKTIISYGEIPGFVRSAVAVHKGNWLFGHLEERLLVMMQGSFPFYEGYTMQQIVFPVRAMKYLGIIQLLISNAG
jgi:Purine nucleoside phosphorylase